MLQLIAFPPPLASADAGHLRSPGSLERLSENPFTPFPPCVGQAKSCTQKVEEEVEGVRSNREVKVHQKEGF